MQCSCRILKLWVMAWHILLMFLKCFRNEAAEELLAQDAADLRGQVAVARDALLLNNNHHFPLYFLKRLHFSTTSLYISDCLDDIKLY